LKFADFEALSFDCYGTLIDWEAGIAAVLGPWARRCGIDLDREHLLAAYAAAEATAEREHPSELYRDILRSQLPLRWGPGRCAGHRRGRGGVGELGPLIGRRSRTPTML